MLFVFDREGEDELSNLLTAAWVAGRGDGCRRVATRSRPRPIRGKVPGKQGQRGAAAAADERRPEGHRRLRARRPVTVARRNRRIGSRKASCGRPRFTVKAYALQ